MAGGGRNVFSFRAQMNLQNATIHTFLEKKKEIKRIDFSSLYDSQGVEGRATSGR